MSEMNWEGKCLEVSVRVESCAPPEAVHRLWQNKRNAEFKGLYFLKCLSSQ